MNHLRQTLIVVVTVVVVVSLVTFGFTFSQVTQEKDRLEADIEYRSSVLASAVKEPIKADFASKQNDQLQGVVDRFADDRRVAGLGIVDSMENVVAASSSLVRDIPAATRVATDAMDSNKPNTAFAKFGGQRVYAFAEPIQGDHGVTGAVIVIQNASYIDNYVSGVWSRNLLRLLVQVVIFSLAILVTLHLLVQRPLRKLLALVRSSPNDQPGGSHAHDDSPFGPVLQEFSIMQKNLIRAREAALEATKSSLEKLYTPWTAERLQGFTKDLLKNRAIVTISNREPYMHYKEAGKIRYLVPTGGMITALNSVMQACGGLWIAHGNGDADMETSDKEGKLGVPPDDPNYTLKRVWITEEENRGYYDGFSNRALWPLCHMVHIRPTFNQNDWKQYQKVNQKFADTVIKEIRGNKKPVIVIQDYHFALLPRLIKEARPDASVSIFWHIPWPNSEAFSICPWKREILDGLLGADAIGFQTQLYCNNFVATVSDELEALVDTERLSITRGAHTSFVEAFPISIDFTGRAVSRKQLEAEAKAAKKLRQELGITAQYVGAGVERLDYTKGLLERIHAIELFLDQNPSYREDFTFVQVADPSRTSVKEYQEFDQRLTEEIDRVNNRFKSGNWRPIIFIREHRNHEFIYTLCRTANLFLVTPLHDGMNLVAKEFVAARNDEQGVLILSQFAGAAQELREALIVNPYDAQKTAETIRAALEMQPVEQRKRMRKLRTTVKDNNVYRWSAEILKRVAELD